MRRPASPATTTLANPTRPRLVHSSSSLSSGLSLDPDSTAYGPPADDLPPLPLSPASPIPRLRFDLEAELSSLSPHGFEGERLPVARLRALGIEVGTIHCMHMPAWVRRDLVRQARKSEEDCAWLCVEAGLARLVSSPAYCRGLQLREALDDPSQPLDPSHSDDLISFDSTWAYQLDTMGLGEYERVFRVPADVKGLLGEAAANAGSRPQQLFQVLMLDGLRAGGTPIYREAMDMAVCRYYSMMWKRVRRLCLEVRMLIEYDGLVPTAGLARAVTAVETGMRDERAARSRE